MKKNVFMRILIIALVAMSIMAVAIPAFATPIYTSPFNGKVSTSSGPLNVRSSTSTANSNNIVGTLAHGSTAHWFCGYYPPGNVSYAYEWLLVYYNGDINSTPLGLVSARYISWLPSYGTGGNTSTTVSVTPGEYVRLRTKPNGTVIAHLHNGDQVLVLGSYNDPVSGWTRIATAEGTGWIMSSYLTGAP